MSNANEVDLYDGHYGRLGAEAQVAVRRETYDEDLGQSSWITLAEALQFFRALDLQPGDAALEVACGAGGVTCRMALETGATCVGVDLHAQAIEGAIRRGRARPDAAAGSRSRSRERACASCGPAGP